MIDNEVRSPEQQELVDAYNRGELTRDELSRAWGRLWEARRLENLQGEAVDAAVAWLRR